MKMTKVILYFSLIPILVVGAVFIHLSKNEENNTTMLRTEVFKTNGWGYNIIVKNKTFIHQKFIPAVSGNQQFKSENDANKVAKLVFLKMKAGKMPTINKYELDSLKIKYDDL
jgi:hypothetical protein